MTANSGQQCVQAEGKWRKKSSFKKLRLAEDGTTPVGRFCHFMALWPQILVSRNFGKLTRYHIFRSFSVATISKTTLCWAFPVEALDVSTPKLFLCLLTPEKPRRGWPQGEEKGGNKVPFQNTCFGVMINAARARSPDKIKQLYNSIFSESRAIDCIYW